MAKSEKNLNAVFTDTANAIRAKGVTGTMTPRDFADKIGTIPTGVTPTGTYDITSNGEYDITNYANVDVDVQGGKVILPINVDNANNSINFDPASGAGFLRPYNAEHPNYTHYIQEEGSEDIKIEGSFLEVQEPVEGERSCSEIYSDILDNPESSQGADNLVIVLAGVCSDNMDIDYDSRLYINLTNAEWISDRYQAISWLKTYFDLNSSISYIKIVDMNGRLLKQTTFDDSLFSIGWSGGC